MTGALATLQFSWPNGPFPEELSASLAATVTKVNAKIKQLIAIEENLANNHRH